MKTQHPIRSLCDAMAVSTSGYYDWVIQSTNCNYGLLLAFCHIYRLGNVRQ